MSDTADTQSLDYALPELREILVALLISGVLVIGISLCVGKTQKFNGDEYRYVMQAENPLSVLMPPHGLRILTPRLAWLIPVDLRQGFYIMTLLSMTGTVALAYILLRTIGCTIPISATALSVLLLHRGIHESLFHYPLVDSLSFLLIELGILATLLQRDRLFSLSLTLGVLNRETSLFLIPFYHFARSQKPFSLRGLAATTLVCSGGILALIMTRSILLSVSDRAYLVDHVQQFYPTLSSGFGRFDRFYLAEFREIVSNAERMKEILSLRTLTSGFGILAPFSLLGLVWGRREIRYLTLYLLCVLIQPFFAHQVTRLVFFSFPFFLLAGGEALRRLQGISSRYQYAFLFAIILGKIVGSTHWPMELSAGIFLAAAFLLLLRMNGIGIDRGRKTVIDSHGPMISRSPLRALRAGLAPEIALLIFLVILNTALIHLCRPTPLARLQEHFHDLHRLSGGQVDPNWLLYDGEAQIGRINIHGKPYETLVPTQNTVSVLLPLESDILDKRKSIMAIVISYPRRETHIRVGIAQGPENGRMIIERGFLRLIPYAQHQLNRVNTSLPMDYSLESTENKYVYIGLPKDVVLIDVFLFDCEKYLSVKRDARITAEDVS